MATYLGTYTTDQFENVLGGIKYTYKMDVRVEYEQSIANNTTTLYITPTVTFKNQGSVGYAINLYFKVDGTDYSSKYWNFGTWGHSCTADTAYEKVITHNEDGTKSFDLNVSCETNQKQEDNAGLNEWVPKWFRLTETITLPTIDRPSPFSFSGDFTMGSSKSIKISPYVSSFTHVVYYSFGNASENISTNATTSASWTPSRELGHQIPNSTSGVGTITVTTYNGSTKIGSTSKTFTLWVAGDMYPTFGYNYTQNNAFNGLLLTTRSSVTFGIKDALGSYGSTIKSYSISGTGLNTTSSQGTSSVFSNSGTFTYTLSITDSRGRKTTQTKSINVYRYQKPTISLEVSRCMQDGTLSDVGNYASAKVTYSISNPNNANQNAKQIKIEYKLSTDSTWIEFKGKEGESSYSGTKTYTNTNITFNSAHSYDFRAIVYDSFHSVQSTASISTSGCILDIEPGGVGVGKYHQNGALDVLGDIYVGGSKFYEVGTFSPSFYVSDGCSMIFSRRTGEYQLIGKYCMCNISLVVEQFNKGSSPSYQFKIIGLPFINKGPYTACTIGYQNGIIMDNAYQTRAYVRPNEDGIVFIGVRASDNSVATISGNHCDSTLDIQISLTYRVRE